MVIINPIFNEYITFLKDNNIDLELQEGYYWLDRQIIKAYDKQGKIHKVARLKIDDQLNITNTLYKKENFEIESWEETVERNAEKLAERERETLYTIKLMVNKYVGYEPMILNSTGKDSCVTAHLVKQIVNAQDVFNNTSLDCADTYKFVKKMDDVMIINPKEGFYKWVDKNIIPTRFSRGCCTYFKEGAMKDNLDHHKKYLFFMGMRNEESAQRSGYENEWKNVKWGDMPWQGILPIREWSEEEIWLYIFKMNIPFNTKYKKGYARVGCAIACPFYTKSTWILDKYWYPGMYKRWHDILSNDFIDNDKWTKLNCTFHEYHMNWNGGLVRPEPNEEVISEFAMVMTLDHVVAAKYFNHTCKVCDKKVNKKNDIAMNLKFLGRNIDEFHCKKHLMELLELDKEQWNYYVDTFTKSDCNLF